MSTIFRALSRRLGIAVALLLLAAAGARAESLSIVAASGETHRFEIEVADNDQERMRGLMFREQLADDAGMLFVYPGPTRIVMWMKNTPLSLDMFFIDGKGTITSIAADTKPYSLDNIPADRPVVGVLEVVAGTAARLGIRPGDRIDYPAFH